MAVNASTVSLRDCLQAPFHLFDRAIQSPQQTCNLRSLFTDFLHLGCIVFLRLLQLGIQFLECLLDVRCEMGSIQFLGAQFVQSVSCLSGASGTMIKATYGLAGSSPSTALFLARRASSIIPSH